MNTEQHGFGLVAVMVALLIISIGVVGVFQIQQLMMRQDDIISHYMRALYLAESELELIRAGSGDETLASEDNAQFQMEISQQAASPGNPLYRVTVSVCWADIQGGSHSVTLSTRIARLSVTK